MSKRTKIPLSLKKKLALTETCDKQFEDIMAFIWDHGDDALLSEYATACFERLAKATSELRECYNSTLEEAINNGDNELVDALFEHVGKQIGAAYGEKKCESKCINPFIANSWICARPFPRTAQIDRQMKGE
jgi:hypothetical protein